MSNNGWVYTYIIDIHIKIYISNIRTYASKCKPLYSCMQITP